MLGFHYSDVDSRKRFLNGTLAHDHSTRREAHTDHDDHSKIIPRKCAMIQTGE
jgi:hypothetical protein